MFGLIQQCMPLLHARLDRAVLNNISPDVSCNQREIVRDNLISVDRQDSQTTTDISRDQQPNHFADTASTGPHARSFTNSGNGLRTEKATGGVLASGAHIDPSSQHSHQVVFDQHPPCRSRKPPRELSRGCRIDLDGTVESLYFLGRQSRFQKQFKRLGP